ncbi:MAG: HTH domain-containing protein [Phycisphaerales bacterium]|nr:HTH domain-containing protein [Phycisphaerales bacterium]
MLYQRSLEIERRLEAVLGMIRKGSYSTPRIAEELGVSIPTVSRDVTALRQRGHDIRAERGEDGWRYVLVQGKNHRKGRRSSDPARGEGH